MTPVGVDVRFADGMSPWGDPFETLEHWAGEGMAGIAIRTIDELAPTLDAGLLTDFAAAARERGLYVEMGIGRVNPYMTAEFPRVRELGDGSYLAGMTRMIEVCGALGWSTLWTALAEAKMSLPGAFRTDRFRTDVDWDEQLRQTLVLLRRLAPVLRDNGCALAIETHEEVTTHELVRLIDGAGADAVGVCLDPANLPVRGENPMDAVRRVAPHVRSTHLRDVAMWRTETALSRFIVPCGAGMIDWGELLAVVLEANPRLNLTIEGIGPVRAEMPLFPEDETWRAHHPDLSAEELGLLAAAAVDYEARAARGEVEPLAVLRERVPRRPAHDVFVRRCAAHLHDTLTTLSRSVPVGEGETR